MSTTTANSPRTAQRGPRRLWEREHGENICEASWPFCAVLEATTKGSEPVKRRETRFDVAPLSSGLTKFVTPQEAHEHLTGQQEGAEAARLRMLARMGLTQEDGPAAAARDRMIQRQNR